MLWNGDDSQKAPLFESCGKFVSRGEWIHPRRVLHSYEIIAVLSGKVYLREGKTEYVAEKNHVLLLSPDTEHSGYRYSRGVSFYWLHFRLDAVPNQKYFIFSDAEMPSLLSLFRILLHDVNTPLYPESSAVYLTRLILNEISYLSDRKQRKNDVAEKVADYILSDLARRPSVSEIAEHFGYHPDYLSRLFRKSFGQSLGAYIAEQTVKRAKYWLSENEKSVAEIARELGFENANAFTHYFKYHEGITPSHYASIYYNTHENHA